MLRQAWQRVQSVLHADEAVLASFEPDLDDQFHFAAGLVVLTNRRLISIEPVATSANGKMADAPLRSWPIEEVTALRSRDRAGLGILEAEGSGGRLAYWRYTVGRSAEINRLVEGFLAFRRGEGVNPDEDENEDQDTDFAGPAAERNKSPRRHQCVVPSGAIRRARTGLIVLGFALTVASTAASLVPTYLIIGLTDNVLSPYQNRWDNIKDRKDLPPAEQKAELTRLQQSELHHFMTVGWYLLALLAAAVLTWLLAWGQGVVMAFVSERISADLRNETYAHLNKLSLEFFGGRRTGDLISRLSSDTERLCGYMSDNVVDFAADVLMIIGTAGMLFWLDPILAAATLFPFPIIGYVVYRVANADAARVSSRRPGLVAHDQRAGRHHSRHAGGQGVCPGATRDRPLRPGQRIGGRGQRSGQHVWTFFWPMVAMLNQIGLLIVWGFGAMRLFDLPSRSACCSDSRNSSSGFICDWNR